MIAFVQETGWLINDVTLAMLSCNHSNNVFFFPVLFKAQIFLH